MAINGPRLRAGVVGAGHMGQYHVLVYAELPDIELAGVADIEADRAHAIARQYDTQAFTDHRQLIGKVDVASVAVPTERHFAVARDLLEAIDGAGEAADVRGFVGVGSWPRRCRRLRC